MEHKEEHESQIIQFEDLESEKKEFTIITKTYEECMNENLYEVTKINSYTCYLLKNGQANIDTGHRKILYESIDALQSAMIENKKA